MILILQLIQTICLLLSINKNELFEMAEKFSEACEHILEQKRKYQNILMKLIDFSFVVVPNAIPISRLWKSIKIGSDSDLQKCLQESRKNWPLLITLRKSPSTEEFKQAMSDDRVKNLGIPKWKPMHLMIYFDRVKMINELIDFSGRSLRKALTIENK